MNQYIKNLLFLTLLSTYFSYGMRDQLVRTVAQKVVYTRLSSRNYTQFAKRIACDTALAAAFMATSCAMTVSIFSCIVFPISCYWHEGQLVWPLFPGVPPLLGKRKN